MNRTSSPTAPADHRHDLDAADGTAPAPGVGPGRLRRLFAFPDPVNEVSARLVAAGVVLFAAVTAGAGLPWATIPLAYGFVARVLTGPTLSPWGQVVTRVLTPRLRVPARPVPGPPKRFAQGIGAAFSVTAAVLTGLGHWEAAQAVLAALAAAAFLEAALGLCLGCKAFALLMQVGVIPPSVCERCAIVPLPPTPV